MRPSTLGLSAVAVGLVATGLTFVAAIVTSNGVLLVSRESAELVSRLGLTDLALFTEARYTRHPTQADLHTAFQDHPLALEHFPSGALTAPIAARVSSDASLARASTLPR
jgi:hypothetical protein